jgi:hypothetical protein
VSVLQTANKPLISIQDVDGLPRRTARTLANAFASATTTATATTSKEIADG